MYGNCPKHIANEETMTQEHLQNVMINRKSMAFETQLAPSICPAPLQLSRLQALPQSGTAKNTGLPLPPITSEGHGICFGVADH